MDLALVTTNEGKFREARELLAPFGVRLRWRRRALPEPQADTLEEVARAKLAVLGDVGGDLLVEDSGLLIPSLGGFPGVYSAYIYRIWGLAPLLELTRRRSPEAVFRCVVGVRVGGRTRLFVGECPGRISRSLRGSHGFGFDPIFRPEDERRTFGEMTRAEKGRYSHRGRAFRAFGRWAARAPLNPRART